MDSFLLFLFRAPAERSNFRLHLLQDGIPERLRVRTRFFHSRFPRRSVGGSGIAPDLFRLRPRLLQKRLRPLSAGLFDPIGFQLSVLHSVYCILCQNNHHPFRNIYFIY